MSLALMQKICLKPTGQNSWPPGLLTSASVPWRLLEPLTSLRFWAPCSLLSIDKQRQPLSLPCKQRALSMSRTHNMSIRLGISRDM
jgi:hypothetical protein